MTRILVVSEDPDFIADVQARFRGSETKVMACLGPVHNSCDLLTRDGCRLATAVSSVLVDAPPGGEFSYLSERVAARSYAEELQRAHPDVHVYLAEAEPGDAGPTGEVTVVANRELAVELLTH